MKGRNQTLLTTMDKLYGFSLKLKLWLTNVAQDVFEMFPLTAAKTKNLDILKKSICGDLEMFQQRFESYFPDLEIFKYDWVRNPFNQSALSNAGKLKLKAQEQLAEIRMDRTLQLTHFFGSLYGRNTLRSHKLFRYFCSFPQLTCVNPHLRPYHRQKRNRDLR